MGVPGTTHRGGRRAVSDTQASRPTLIAGCLWRMGRGGCGLRQADLKRRPVEVVVRSIGLGSRWKEVPTGFADGLQGSC